MTVAVPEPAPAPYAPPSAGRSLSLEDLPAVAARRWRSITAVVAVVLLLTVVWALLAPRAYTATATAVVTSVGVTDVDQAVSADGLAKSRAVQNQELATSRHVVEDALRRAGDGRTPEEVGDVFSAEVPMNTAMVRLSATDASPETAARLADAWVDALVASAAELSGTSSDPVRLTSMVPADVPQRPSAPNVPLVFAAGTLVALLLAVVVALLRERMDQKIGSTSDLRALGVVRIGAIPAAGALDKGHRLLSLEGVGTLDDDSFHSREAFNELRTNLQFMQPDSPPEVITVTSASPGEGKSTVAANLALVLAQGPHPVLLVDADLRRPTVAQTFGLVADVGLSDVISGRATVQEAVQPTGIPQLHVMAAGQIPPNPSELVSSGALVSLMDELRLHYRVVIDSPPLLAVSDAAVLATRFDGAIMVVDAQQTRLDSLERSLDSIRRVNGTVLGVVLNRTREGRAGTAGPYRYGYAAEG